MGGVREQRKINLIMALRLYGALGLGAGAQGLDALGCNEPRASQL